MRAVISSMVMVPPSVEPGRGQVVVTWKNTGLAKSVGVEF